MAGKKASRAQRLAWVEQNRLRKADTIKADEPPDMATLDLWELAQDDEWWKAIFKAHSATDVKSGVTDVADDQRALTILDGLDAEFTRAEGASDE